MRKRDLFALIRNFAPYNLVPRGAQANIAPLERRAARRLRRHGILQCGA